MTMKGSRKIEQWSRRRVLRGMLNGGAVTLGLPLLNCFLNESGTACASGNDLPLRFGTWFWGLGMASQVFVPKKTGAGYDLPEEIAAMEGVRARDQRLHATSPPSGDGAPNLCHYSGWIITRTGQAPATATTGPARRSTSRSRDADRRHAALPGADRDGDRRRAQRATATRT